MIQRKLGIPTVTLCVLSAFILGAGVSEFGYKLPKKIYDFLVTDKTERVYEFGSYRRLIKDNFKIEKKCPEQTEEVGILLSLGQSNAANSGEYRYKTDELSGVYNYFNGRCYLASSPLLGATGTEGEWISKMAHNLISNSTYEKVVVISTGIAASPITAWSEGSGLNIMLRNILNTVIKKYSITDIIWHQGESEYIWDTNPEVYKKMFLSLRKTIIESDVEAPIFMSIASFCNSVDNPSSLNKITTAQKELTRIDGIELGVNTDKLVPVAMRNSDKCHFGKAGQELASVELARIISEFHK